MITRERQPTRQTLMPTPAGSEKIFSSVTVIFTLVLEFVARNASLFARQPSDLFKAAIAQLKTDAPFRSDCRTLASGVVSAPKASYYYGGFTWPIQSAIHTFAGDHVFLRNNSSDGYECGNCGAVIFDAAVQTCMDETSWTVLMAPFGTCAGGTLRRTVREIIRAKMDAEFVVYSARTYRSELSRAI